MIPATSVTDLLQKLIRIPSVNPDGDPGTTETGEKKCAEFVGEFLQALGAEVEFREVLPGRPNVLGHFPGKPGRPRLLFAPHTDTVTVSGMTVDPFGGELRDGRIYGRGASDTKGSIAAILWALQAAREHLGKLSYEIWFAGLVGEEAGLNGSRALSEQEKFDFAIVGEPTNLQIVHSHKGAIWLRISTRGRAAHGSRPEEGESAILKMNRVLNVIVEDIMPRLASRSHSLLGSPTLNVGTVNGGSKINIVPDRCFATLDIRITPDEEDSAWLEDVCQRLRAAEPALEIEILQKSTSLYTDPAHPIIDTLRACGAGLTTAKWFSDAGPLSRGGTPTICIGPGSIAQAHTADEFILVEDLEAGAEFFTRFLHKLV